VNGGYHLAYQAAMAARYRLVRGVLRQQVQVPEGLDRGFLGFLGDERGTESPSKMFALIVELPTTLMPKRTPVPTASRGSCMVSSEY
jgi:hypothetical protein